MNHKEITIDPRTLLLVQAEALYAVVDDWMKHGVNEDNKAVLDLRKRASRLTDRAKGLIL